MSDSLSPLSTYRQGHFFSPAKINLFFRVLSKRSDGYHNIASLYQTINFGDDLFVNKTAGQDLFTTSDRTLPLGKGNLVVRAIQLFRESYPLPSVHIHLKKRIPKEAGLGGGSSNAATTLWALNQISGSLAGLDDLIRMGSEIGSDVPFFFSRGTAYCTSRGETMKDVFIPLMSGRIIKPSFGLSTRSVYEQIVPERLVQRDPAEDLRRFEEGYPIYYNDLEGAALSIEPRLIPFREKLISFGLDTICMTGSGSAYFCLGSKDSMIFGGKQFSAIRRESHFWY